MVKSSQVAVKLCISTKKEISIPYLVEKAVNAKIDLISTENKRTQVGQMDMAKYHRENILKLRCGHSSTRNEM